MGWWKVRGTEDVIGDGPLDCLNGAIVDVVSQYVEAFRRKPTTKEWERLLSTALRSHGTQHSVTQDGNVTDVAIQVERSDNPPTDRVAND